MVEKQKTIKAKGNEKAQNISIRLKFKHILNLKQIKSKAKNQKAKADVPSVDF